eukprot:Em1155g1a
MDLRKPSEPVAEFKDHRKPVHFINNHELVSASTDSALKLWDINKGIVNEKNFIGLTHFIACGESSMNVLASTLTLTQGGYNVILAANYQGVIKLIECCAIALCRLCYYASCYKKIFAQHFLAQISATTAERLLLQTMNSTSGELFTPPQRSQCEPDITSSKASSSSPKAAKSVNKSRSRKKTESTSQCSQDDIKPPCSYVALITMAISQSPKKILAYGEICDYIIQQFPYYRKRWPAWKDSIRQTLSLNDCFIKVKRSSSSGTSNFWKLHPLSGEMFNNAQSVKQDSPMSGSHIPSFGSFRHYQGDDLTQPSWSDSSPLSSSPSSMLMATHPAYGGVANNTSRPTPTPSYPYTICHVFPPWDSSFIGLAPDPLSLTAKSVNHLELRGPSV